MTRYNIYTTLIGIISVFLIMSVYSSDFDMIVKILLTVIGMGFFLHSALKLYLNQELISKEKKINKIILLDQNGESVQSWELYGKVSMVIGKDIGENNVDIDLRKSPYAAMIDIEHAVLNYAEGNWFIEDLDSRNGISIKKITQNKSYKLSPTQPCKIDCGDVIFIGNCKLLVAN